MNDLATLNNGHIQHLLTMVESRRPGKKVEAPRHQSAKLKLLMAGDFEAAGFGDVSAAVQSLLTLLAVEHLLDPVKIEAAFKASGMYRDFRPLGRQSNWIEKWDRLRTEELDKAIGHARALMEKKGLIDDSDQALVEGFAAEKRDEFRYLADDRSWSGYKSGLWEELPAGPIYAIGEHLKAQEPSDSNKALHKRLNSEKAISAVERLAKHRPEFHICAKDFDPDPWLLGLPCGLALDQRTGEVRGARPGDLLTRALPVIPSEQEPEVACPRWIEYLEQAHPGDRELQGFLKRLFGYYSTASTREDQITFFIGPGGAGKGVATETGEAVLGPYYCQLPLDLLLEEAKEDRRLNHIAELRGKRLGVCNEGARSKKLDRNALKNLTGGGSVTGRRLGHQAFSFPMTAKILIVSNDEPILDLDDAMKQRVHVVPFKVVFRGDPNRDDKNLKQFLKEKELPGIARWMVDGCLEWQKIGLKPPDSVVSRTQEYFVNADLFDQFLLEACEFGSEFFTPTLALFVAARNFCEARGEKTTVTSQRIFVADLEKRRPQLKAARPRGEGFSGQSGFFGIRLKQGLVVAAPF